jgi:hypothetical protein
MTPQAKLVWNEVTKQWDALPGIPEAKRLPVWELSAQLWALNAEMSGRFTPNQFGGPDFFREQRQRAV